MKSILCLAFLVSCSSQQLSACSMPPKSGSLTILNLIYKQIDSSESIEMITLRPNITIKTRKHEKGAQVCYLRQYESKWHPVQCSAELINEEKEQTSC